jgi:hypothetical protein
LFVCLFVCLYFDLNRLAQNGTRTLLNLVKEYRRELERQKEFSIENVLKEVVIFVETMLTNVRTCITHSQSFHIPSRCFDFEIKYSIRTNLFCEYFQKYEQQWSSSENAGETAAQWGSILYEMATVVTDPNKSKVFRNVRHSHFNFSFVFILFSFTFTFSKKNVLDESLTNFFVAFW